MQLPNHTQVSNDLIDNYMSEIEGSDLKVMLAIARKTIGWHKNTDKISLTQLEKLTGNARQTIVDAIERLEKEGLISVDRSGKINEFEINYNSLTNRPVQSLDQQQSNNKTSDSLITRHTKETNTKETNTKETNTKDSDDDDSLDYVKWVDYWNEVNDAQCRITSKKRKQIRSRLRTWDEDELKKAIANRAEDPWMNNEGEKYKTKWSSFWVNDEKVEHWLQRDASKDKELENHQYKIL